MTWSFQKPPVCILKSPPFAYFLFFFFGLCACACTCVCACDACNWMGGLACSTFDATQAPTTFTRVVCERGAFFFIFIIIIFLFFLGFVCVCMRARSITTHYNHHLRTCKRGAFDLENFSTTTFAHANGGLLTWRVFFFFLTNLNNPSRQTKKPSDQPTGCV